MNTLAHLIVDRADTLLGGATATFSPCRTYRYTLTRVWDPSRSVVVFIMLNPSTANAFVEDPTIRRCLAFSRSWMAGGIVVHNLFGLRSTDPRKLYRHPDPVGPDNDAVIADTFTSGLTVARVIAAWGVHGTLNDRGEQVRALFANRGIRLTCFGTTKDGHPRHPLYVRGDAAVVEYPTKDDR